MGLTNTFQNWFFSLGRSFFPVLKIGKSVYIFRDADVKEVLSRDKDFTISEINADNIERHTGPFILGMDAGPQYDRDVGILRRSVKKEDVGRIQNFIRTQSSEIAENLSGSFDVIDKFTREVPYRMMGEYFGVAGPDRASMLTWCRTIFYDIFLNLKNEESIRQAGLKSSQAMNPYVLDLIAQRKKTLAEGRELPDDMLCRLIEMQGGEQPAFADEEIPGNLAGVYMGFLEPTSKAVVNILGQFFKRPEVLQQARAAAKEEDTDRMLGLAMEAMRFHPNAPVLLRYNAKDQTIGGKDGRKRRKIPGGKKLYVMTKSAMFDKRSVEDPKRFKGDRPRETYLYFGFGMHTCFGNYVNMVSIPEMLIALLKREDLSPKGKVVNDGPFPDKWMWA